LNSQILTQTEPTTASLASRQTFDYFLSREERAPAWWLKQKRENWERFEELPMPTRKTEQWRFANVNAITLDGFSLPAPVDDEAQTELRERSNVLPDVAGKVVFADDHLIEHAELTQELIRKGVIWMPLERAVVEHADLLKKHFMAQPIKLGSEKFSALHGALCRAGTFLYVPKNVEIELPLIAYHWASEEGAAIFPHTLVIAEDNSKVTLVDFFGSREADSRNFICGVNDLYAGTGAKLTYVCAQDWGSNSIAFQLNSTQSFRDSFITSLNVNLGSHFARSEMHNQALGEGGHAEMLSLTVARGEQEFDQRTLQTHVAPNTVSDLLYKNALLDKARTLFSGLIRVEPDAQRVDAYQTNRNLLLNPEAEANSLPGLEILANDVKCSHGATTGRIEQDQLFYFLARGIPQQVAKELLVFGFFDEVLTKLDNETLIEKLRELIRNKFARG
jgi:Fe-S cluster assembly protein SufD